MSCMERCWVYRNKGGNPQACRISMTKEKHCTNTGDDIVHATIITSDCWQEHSPLNKICESLYPEWADSSDSRRLFRNNCNALCRVLLHLHWIRGAIRFFFICAGIQTFNSCMWTISPRCDEACQVVWKCNPDDVVCCLALQPCLLAVRSVCLSANRCCVTFTTTATTGPVFILETIIRIVQRCQFSWILMRFYRSKQWLCYSSSL